MKECFSCHKNMEDLAHTCPNCGGHAFIANGSLAEMKNLAESMLQQEDAAHHVDQALVFFKAGRYDDAEHELKSALDLNPMNSMATGNMGYLMLKLGRPKEAIEWFEKALGLNPDHATVRDGLVQARQQAEAAEKAKSSKTGNWRPGEKVPRTGTYTCIYCGPDGLGAIVLKQAMKSMGIPYTPPASARKDSPRTFLYQGDTFPSCPNCRKDPSNAGNCNPTGWDWVSDSDGSRKTAGPAVKYFECTRPSGDGTCSDDSCPCGYPGVKIPRGTGYFYISKELVEMRRDALGLAEIQQKVIATQRKFGATIVTATNGVFMPILMCELGAKKRGINLEVAAADAKHWWETGLAPLSPTPRAGEVRQVGDVEAPVKGSRKSHVMAGVIGIAIVLLVAAILTPAVLKAREAGQRAACVKNMRLLDAAKQQAGLEHRYGTGDVIPEPQVLEFLGPNHAASICPKGGRYTINVLGKDPECSVHGSLSAATQER